MAARGSGARSQLGTASSRSRRGATKVTLADVQELQKMISLEALQLCEQCNNYVKEIERLNGACELAVYRALEKERNKWEEREA